MKKIAIIAFAAITMLAACTKEDEVLVGTTWSQSSWSTSINTETGDTSSVDSGSFEIKFETATHGHAYLRSSNTRYWEHDTITYSIYGVFDVSYSFNGEDKEGTITFTQEQCEAEMYAEEYLADFWNDPITSSFYTYSDDNKLLLYSCPSDMAYYTAHLVVLTKE